MSGGRDALAAATCTALCLLGACATPSGEGRLVSRLHRVEPATWPDPVPVAEVTGLELDPGRLSNEEALELLPACRDGVVKGLGRAAREAPATEPWRLMISRIVVDVGETRGSRLLRVRAVAELRLHDRLAASATGVATLRSTVPSLRTDGVEPREARATTTEACRLAARALALPRLPTPPQRRAALQAALGSPRASERAAAILGLGSAPDDADGPSFRAALDDADPTVRHAAAWALGELGDASAVERLARLAELDPVYTVRVEAVTALGKLMTVEPGLRPSVRALREQAAEERRQRLAPIAAEAGSDDRAEPPAREIIGSDDSPRGDPQEP